MISMVAPATFHSGLPRRFAMLVKTSAEAAIIRPGAVYDQGLSPLRKIVCAATADQRSGVTLSDAAS
jgi:hypothetical protein